MKFSFNASKLLKLKDGWGLSFAQRQFIPKLGSFHCGSLLLSELQPGSWHCQAKPVGGPEGPARNV